MWNPVVIFLLWFVALGVLAEGADSLATCQFASLDEIGMLSFRGQEKKQYQALMASLVEHTELDKQSDQILPNFYACWKRYRELHEDTSIFELSLEASGSIVAASAGKQCTYKVARPKKLAAQIDKCTKVLFANRKEGSLRQLMWFLWVEAALAATNQQYNFYHYADELSASRTEDQGRSFSVGFIPEIKNGETYIDKILDSKILQAGLQPGMRVDEIESKAIELVDIASWWNQLRPFIYTLKVNDSEHEFKSIPQIYTSAYALTLADYLYIRIDYFSARTDIEMSRIMRGVNKYKGVIIDVRNNGGGVLSPLVIDYFLKPAQEVLVFSMNGDVREKEYGTMAYVDKPLVVIQNKYSASMSELLAAMLQSQKRAVIVGENSSGKSVGQKNIPVLSEGEVFLVKAQYFYVDGLTHWGGVGVVPDIKLEISKEETNKVALELINEEVDLDYLQEFDSSLNAALKVLEEY